MSELPVLTKKEKYKVRSMFIPTPGYRFLAFDLSQAETWVVAHLANEQIMMRALKESDIHSVTAGAIYLPFDPTCDHFLFDKTPTGRKCKGCGRELVDTQRYIGKKNNHGNSYRQSPERSTQSINEESDQPPYVTVTVAEVRIQHAKWHELYRGIKKWWGKIELNLEHNQRTITTVYGRKRTFFDQWGNELFKESTAYEPQSTVGDHTLGRVQKEVGIAGGLLTIYKLPDVRNHCRIVNTSHDSLMMEVPIGSEENIARQVVPLFRRPLIINDMEFTIPVDGEVGDRWGELEEIPKGWLQ